VTDGGKFKKNMGNIEKKAVPIKINKTENRILMKINPRLLRYGMCFENTKDRNDETGVATTRMQ
jgi:hypothetical protein